jgi:CelD/BcsL family acetyltransferase involved in cellulose biosynthesis
VATNQNRIKVELHLLNHDDIKAIELEWLELELRASCHFFLTWDWIGAWIKKTQGPFYILKATRSGQVVALAFIFEKKRKALSIYPVTQWWLNRTGDDKYDQTWIEYNDFLIDKTFENDIRASLVTFISKQVVWDEFISGMMSEEVERQLSTLSLSSKRKRYLIQDTGYQVNLTEIHQSYSADILSRNTRQKINQTRRILEKKGELAFVVLTRAKEKLNALASIESLHIKRWQGSDTPSGFNNPVFSESLSVQVISEYCEISKLSLDDNAIGFLINYVYQGRVYFYLSGLCDNFDGKVKLGMFLHSVTIAHYKEANMNVYDFLAGKSRYKQSLTNISYPQNMCSYQKVNVWLIGESWLKSLKRKLITIVN